MAPTKAPPAALENFYTVKQATVRLNIATEDPEDLAGQRWLRDGVNKQGWPARRMSGRLLFSDSDLAWIADHCLNKPDARSKPRPAGSRRPARNHAAPKTTAPAASR